MPKPVENASRYNPAIDGVRTLAVFAVILYHMNVAWIPGGLLGVGVFFTLSGFLITGNLMRSWYAHGNLGLSTFWLRRLRRLMPAVIIVVLCIWALTPYLAPSSWETYKFAGLTAIFYVNNWATIFYGNSYFDQFALSPFEHMWSLSVEEQFYLFWPLVLLLFLVISRGKKAVVIALTGVVAIASFAWMSIAFHMGFDPTRIYEGTDTRAGALLVGALLALAMSGKPQTTGNSSGRGFVSSLIRTTNRIVADIVGIIGASVIIILMIVTPDSSPFLYDAGIALLSLASAALLYGVSNQHTLVAAIFGWRPVAWIGERSYAIYLWHMPLVAFMREPLSLVPLWLATLIVAAGAIVLASVSWVLVEDPIRRHGFFSPLWSWLHRKSPMPRTIWMLPLAFVLAVGIIGTSTVLVRGAQERHIAQLEAQREHEEQLTRQKAEMAAQHAKERELAATRTRCTEIVHVGDSTSLAMFSDDGVENPDDNAMKVYAATGAHKVVNSSFGARATNQGYEDSPSGNESLRQLIDAGVDSDACFVIALGTNDAANMNVEGKDRSSEHIETTMDIIGPHHPVLWITTIVNPAGAPRWYDKAVMDSWNSALYAELKTHPNMWVYPWDKDVRPNWFIEGDGVHYNQEGSSERSHRFAQAVINAWPLTLKGTAAPLLPNPPLAAHQRIVSGLRPY
ncbi:MAG: acyltransferase family protein [Actinomycetaceae bacterium]|nr:acyltransferase family protein [Arcanobacterium sp.]MDD7687020.1 acyltransferase family protein [Actinomycetaceae bacterium]MDY5273323.1 acyltransferase family protein [Arcanobacterium sp.]